MLRKVSCLVLIICMVASLCMGMTACSTTAKETTTKETTKENVQTAPAASISFWSYDGSPEYSDLFKKYIAEYKAINPNVEVEYLGLPFENAKEKFDTAIATNTAPDAAFIGQNWAVEYAMSDKVAALDSYFDKWDGKSKCDEKLFETGIILGKRCSVPCTATIVTTWYRTDWFEELGLSVPKTFDELFSNIEKITDPLKNRYGFTIRGGMNGSHQLEGFLAAYAGIDSYFDKDGKCFARNPKAIEGAKRYLGAYKKHTPESDINNGFKELVAVFDTGVAGILFHNITSGALHEKTLGEGKYSSFVLPKADNGKRTILFCGVAATDQYLIFKGSKNESVAWDFIAFLLADEHQSEWCKSVNVLPVSKDVAKEDWVKNTQSLVEVNTALADKDTYFISSPFYLPDFESIHANILQPAMQEVMLGQKTVEDFMKLYADEMEKAKKEYDSK